MTFRAGRTIGRFFQSTAFVQIVQGPRREGKTTGGIWKPLYVSEHIPPEHLPLRVAVVRDTWTNLKRSVIDNIEEEQAKGLAVRWMEGKTECLLGGNRAHLFLMGVDQPAKINKLQGFGAAVLWLDEPAPAADISGGIPPEVFGVGVTSLSQAHVPRWVQITMNPPDEDHWILQLKPMLAELRRTGQVPPEFTIEQFDIPPGERVDAAERDRNRIALELIGRGDLVGRLVLGKVGQVQMGEAVVPEFQDTVHVAKHPLPILPGRQVVRMWDFGLTPTCVWSQVTPSGFWHILGVRVGESIGLEQFIEHQVLPWEAEFLPNREAYPFRDIHDPSGSAPDQLNSEKSAITVLADLLACDPEPGPVAWYDRIQSLKAVLNRLMRGKAVVQIDPDECRPLIRALRGGFRFPKDNLGRVTRTLVAAKKVSGIHSHPVDCLAYGAAVLFPLPELIARAARREDRYAKRHRAQPKVARAGSWMRG